MLKELKLSQEAASRFLEAIPRARELYTIFFDEDIRVSRYDSENQQGLFDRIHAAKGGGNTALYDAIAVYLSRVQDGSGRKVLVLFTDGEDTRSALAFTDVVKLVRSGRVTIYAIAFGMYGGGPSRALRPRAVLEQLAAMTGGQVFTPAQLARPGRASTTASSRTWPRSSWSGTSRTTRPATGSSARSRSRRRRRG